MQTLSIDLETYSDQPLAKTGVYRYVESPDFEILLFAYSVDGGSVQQIDLACGEKIPSEILCALEDDKVTKWAFNANFERICLSRFLGYPTGDYLEPDSWKCSMVWAAYMGLPLSLEGAGAVVIWIILSFSEYLISLTVLLNQSLGNGHNILIGSNLFLLCCRKLHDKVTRHVVLQYDDCPALVYKTCYLREVLICFCDRNKIICIDVHRETSFAFSTFIISKNRRNSTYSL